MLITTFDGRYGRRGTIQCSTEVCDNCHKKRIVIEIDSAEDEYYSGKICKECIDKAFNDYASVEEIFQSKEYEKGDMLKKIQCPVVRQFDHVDESFDVKRNDADINLNEQ